MSAQPETDTLIGPVGLRLAREWPTVMMIGLITLALGIVVIAWPQQTLVVVSILLGIQLVIFGVFRLISAFATDAISPGLQGFVGILSIIAGVIVLRNPFETVEVLAVVLGVVWIVGGSIDVIGSIADRSMEHRGWLAFGGLISIAAGIVVVSWPAPTVTVIAWIAGLYLIIFGLFICVDAWQLRRLTK